MWSTKGAVGGMEPTYAEPAVFKFPPSPVNVDGHDNHYDALPSRRSQVPVSSTYENITPGKVDNTVVKKGAFASVLDEEQASPLPTKTEPL